MIAISHVSLCCHFTAPVVSVVVHLPLTASKPATRKLVVVTILIIATTRLEREVLEEVRRAVVLGGLVAAAGVDEDAHSGGLTVATLQGKEKERGKAGEQENNPKRQEAPVFVPVSGRTSVATRTPLGRVVTSVAGTLRR